MKNTLKKVLCTALAAVSLSAMVTVPSSLNKPNSDNSIVNVMEADAAQKPLYTAYMTKDPQGKDRYYIRAKNDPNSEVIQVAYPFAPLKVYKVSDKMVRVSPDNAKEKWVRKSRVQRIYPDDPFYRTHNCKNYSKSLPETPQTFSCKSMGNIKHWSAGYSSIRVKASIFNSKC